MELKPKILSYEKTFQTVDSHTMGEPTRIIVSGFPKLEGNTMMERKKYLVEHYDHYRTALMLEPRGHKDMFGALLTEPVHEEADLGVIFMDSGGYLNMCGHGSIGAATVAVETGLVEVTEPYTEVVLDAPSGIIRTKVKVENGKAVEVSILNVPAFLYKEDASVEIAGYGEIHFDISFGGSFFALVDAEKLGLSITTENIDMITDLGMKLLSKINKEFTIRHPYLDITTVDLVEFYCSPTNPLADKKNVVIFGESQADRSPCGTGTSAKIATLYTKGLLKRNEEFVYESITGSLFKGKVKKEVPLNGYLAIIPEITGSAYVTGYNTWILDEQDPLEYGFLFGKKKEEKKPTTRQKIVSAAWELFYEKGYEETTVEDIVGLAGITKQEFYTYFPEKDRLLMTLSELFDQKYAELMLELNPHLSHYEQLLYLNRELFHMIETRIPISLLSKLYSSEMTKESDRYLMDEHRLYYRLIKQIMEEGIASGEFKETEKADDLAETYEFLERGLLCDWCMKEGNYSLTDYSRKVLSLFLRAS